MTNTKAMELNELDFDQLENVNGGLPGWLKKAVSFIPVLGGPLESTMNLLDGTKNAPVDVEGGLADVLVVPYFVRVVTNLF